MTVPATARFCPTCGAQLSAQARFCHRCGAPAQGAAGRNPERTAWIVAGTVVLVLFGIIAWRVLAGTPAIRTPDMANAGNAAPGGAPAGDPGGPLPTGPAPDISAMTPAERFIRLNNRIMEAAARGDSAAVVNFTPMALGAYAQLDSVSNDERYHAAVLNAQVGRTAEALALTDTMLAVVPGYLLAYVIRADVAQYQNDRARAAAAMLAFDSAYAREIGTRRAEYVDHRNVLDEFRQRPR